jgi:hypothetical protein
MSYDCRKAIKNVKFVLMLRYGLFKTPKHRQFNYKSRFYDAKKEELEKRKRTGGKRIDFDRERSHGVGANSRARMLVLLGMGVVGIYLMFADIHWAYLLVMTGALLFLLFKFSRRA